MSLLLPERVPLKPLAQLLRRMSISLDAGIDVRRMLQTETQHNMPALRSRLQSIKEEVDQGTSLNTAVRHTGEYFPPLVRELVDVGEQTGHLPEVLRQLSAHY